MESGESVHVPSWAGKVEGLNYQISRIESRVLELNSLNVRHLSRPGMDEGSEEDEGPTAGEIADYARNVLGLDPVWDTDLLWIATEGLDAPLPEGWVEHHDEASGSAYFHDEESGAPLPSAPLRSLPNPTDAAAACRGNELGAPARRAL